MPPRLEEVIIETQSKAQEKYKNIHKDPPMALESWSTSDWENEVNSQIKATAFAAWNAGREEMVQDVLGSLFARCSLLRMEIESQEEKHGTADTSTLTRLSEAEKMYAEFKEGFRTDHINSLGV